MGTAQFPTSSTSQVGQVLSVILWVVTRQVHPGRPEMSSGNYSEICHNPKPNQTTKPPTNHRARGVILLEPLGNVSLYACQRSGVDCDLCFLADLFQSTGFKLLGENENSLPSVRMHLPRWIDFYSCEFSLSYR